VVIVWSLCSRSLLSCRTLRVGPKLASSFHLRASSWDFRDGNKGFSSRFLCGPRDPMAPLPVEGASIPKKSPLPRPHQNLLSDCTRESCWKVAGMFRLKWGDSKMTPGVGGNHEHEQEGPQGTAMGLKEAVGAKPWHWARCLAGRCSHNTA
jgi:hypothetical protein